MSDKNTHLSKLSIDQRKAASNHGNTAIVACPGSGKTETLIARAAHLLEDPMRKICLVTFTRTAAEDMRKRIAGIVTSCDKRYYIATFHKTILGQAKNSGVDMLDPAQERAIIEQIYRRYPNADHLSIAAFTRFFSQAERKVYRGERLTDYEALVLNRFEYRKKQVNSITLDEFVNDTVLRIERGEIPTLACTDIFVDEFQDSDPVQLRWILAHARTGIDITVVGDDDQAIYGFRKSLGNEAFTIFSEATKAKVFQLNVNYRSHSEILNPACNLISHNADRIQKNIHAYRGEGGEFHHQYERTEREHIKYLSEVVAEGPADWAVLCRDNMKLERIAVELSERKVPHYHVGETILKDIVTIVLMQCVADCDSVVKKTKRAREKLVLLWSLIMGYGHLSDAVVEAGVSCLRDANLELADGPTRIELTKYLDVLFSCHQLSVEKNYERSFDTAADYLKKITGYENYDKIYSRTRDLFMSLHGTVRSRARKVLNAKPISDDQGVALATMHGSKGCQWPRVAIPYVVDDCIPNMSHIEVAHTADGSSSSSELYEKAVEYRLQEERNLFYVAMTRAQDTLYLVAFTDGRWGRDMQSRFDYELCAPSLASQCSPERDLDSDAAAQDPFYLEDY